MPVYGTRRLGKIAKKFHLPYWWVQSVVIEHFSCRRFLEDGELWTFDFDIFDKNLIDSIPEKKVVIPEYYMAQNVTSKELSEKILNSVAGMKSAPIKKEDVNPEGPLNETAFPYLGNPIEIWDPKLGFHRKTVVFDNGVFYQWHIAELYGRTKGSSWHKSDLFGLESLWEAYGNLMKIRTRKIMDNPTTEHRKLAQKLYDEYEKARAPLREIIWNYHKKQKEVITGKSDGKYEFTIFETQLQSDAKITITSLEPIFYRAAIRNKILAKTASEKLIKEHDQKFIYDEIEYTIFSIIASINCLESFINSVIQQYELAIGIEDNIRQKWKKVTKQLIPKYELLENEEPFKTFSTFVNWRNDVVHYKFHYKTIVDDKLLIHDRYRFENAEKAATLVKTMILLFENMPDFSIPSWLNEEHNE